MEKLTIAQGASQLAQLEPFKHANLVKKAWAV